MRNPFYILFFFAIIAFSYKATAQIEISGTIVNSESGEPVPFAYVKKKSINRGAITNEDGYFELVCDEDDTLLVSFISFQRIAVPCTYFKNNKQLLLKPSNNELATVDIYADFEFLYELFETARKNLKQSATYPTKTYFALETATSGIPVELLECYYNAEIGPSGINDLALKNGRIGMSEQDGTYFASLNTTQIISDYRLLNKRDNRFPINPLQLSKGRLRKCYKLKLVSFKEGIYQINFIPKKEGLGYFNSTIWIDKKSEQIVQIELDQTGLQKHPFVPIDPQHHMDSLNFNISYTFSNDGAQSLDKIAFSYDLKYNNRHQNRHMNSNGVFLFFEKNEKFELPYYSETSHKLSDYDKIVAQPYNEIFWSQNEVISPSRKTILYQQYFKRAGVLLNFNELSRYNALFKNRIVEWSKRRILIDEINSDGNYMVSRKNDVHNTSVQGNFYNLQAHIYLDRNVRNDSIFYLSKTLIDIEDSYYYLEINKYTACIINTYFDLVEFERRQMMAVLESQVWEKHQVDSIYAKSQKWLDDNLKFYLAEVDHGENARAVARFNKVIYGNLEIDNSLLIWSDYMAGTLETNANDMSAEPWIELYNYGTALMQIGEYEKALPVLLAAYEMGSRDPWLTYNIGLNYLKLNQIKKGCEFLSLAKELGEKIPEELTSECE
jgi:hypothetical protein